MYSYKRSQLCLKIKQLSYKSNLPYPVEEMAKHCAMLIVHLVFHCQAQTGIRFAFHFRLLNTAGWWDRNGNLQIKCSLICRNGVYNGSIHLTWRWWLRYFRHREAFQFLPVASICFWPHHLCVLTSALRITWSQMTIFLKCLLYYVREAD